MNIHHDPVRREFSTTVNGASAYLRYDVNDDRMNIRSTFVPADLRGQGIARELVDASLAFARTEGMTAEASCSYAARVIESRGGQQS